MISRQAHNLKVSWQYVFGIIFTSCLLAQSAHANTQGPLCESQLKGNPATIEFQRKSIFSVQESQQILALLKNSFDRKRSPIPRARVSKQEIESLAAVENPESRSNGLIEAFDKEPRLLQLIQKEDAQMAKKIESRLFVDLAQDPLFRNLPKEFYPLVLEQVAIIQLENKCCVNCPWCAFSFNNVKAPYQQLTVPLLRTIFRETQPLIANKPLTTGLLYYESDPWDFSMPATDGSSYIYNYSDVHNMAYAYLGQKYHHVTTVIPRGKEEAFMSAITSGKVNPENTSGGVRISLSHMNEQRLKRTYFEGRQVLESLHDQSLKFRNWQFERGQFVKKYLQDQAPSRLMEVQTELRKNGYEAGSVTLEDSARIANRATRAEFTFSVIDKFPKIYLETKAEIYHRAGFYPKREFDRDSLEDLQLLAEATRKIRAHYSRKQIHEMEQNLREEIEKRVINPATHSRMASYVSFVEQTGGLSLFEGTNSGIPYEEWLLVLRRTREKFSEQAQKIFSRKSPEPLNVLIQDVKPVGGVGKAYENPKLDKVTEGHTSSDGISCYHGVFLSPDGLFNTVGFRWVTKRYRDGLAMVKIDSSLWNRELLPDKVEISDLLKKVIVKVHQNGTESISHSHIEVVQPLTGESAKYKFEIRGQDIWAIRVRSG